MPHLILMTSRSPYLNVPLILQRSFLTSRTTREQGDRRQYHKPIGICSPGHALAEEELALLAGVYLCIVETNETVAVGAKFGSNMFV